MTLSSTQIVSLRRENDEPKADKPLLGSFMRKWAYRGTDIDGPVLEPEGLWIRGKDLTEQMQSDRFACTLLHMLEGEMPSEERVVALDSFMRAAALSAPESTTALRVAADTAVASGSPVAGLAAGLLAVSGGQARRWYDEQPAGLGLDAEVAEAIAAAAAAPILLAAGISALESGIGMQQRISAAAAATDYVGSMLALARGDATASDGQKRLFEAMLVAWHGGFGYITPTVMVPRAVIGTGVNLIQAMAAGCMAGGPNHIGACERAMAWFHQIRASTAPDASHAVLAAAAVSALELKLAAGEMIYGFGHPLFVADPRPPVLRRLFAPAAGNGHYLAIYDAVCEGMSLQKNLNPNIDAATAVACLELGLCGNWWGSGLGLCARTSAMIAHTLERRNRPAFGVNSKTARAYLASVPVGWL